MKTSDQMPFHIYPVPVWTGAWKLGTAPCGWCGSTEHKWLQCHEHRCEHGHLRSREFWPPFECCCPHGIRDKANCTLTVLDCIAQTIRKELSE